jgi:hypothetical protein
MSNTLTDWLKDGLTDKLNLSLFSMESWQSVLISRYTRIQRYVCMITGVFHWTQPLPIAWKTLSWLIYWEYCFQVVWLEINLKHGDCFRVWIYKDIFNLKNLLGSPSTHITSAVIIIKISEVVWYTGNTRLVFRRCSIWVSGHWLSWQIFYDFLHHLHINTRMVPQFSTAASFQILPNSLSPVVLPFDVT